MFPLPKEIWTEVISLYKNMPFLWDKKDPEYSSRYARDSGYNIILKKYKEYDKHANLAIIKKKIDNMRTSYRRELKKVLASKHHGSDSEEYVPELWYFDLLTFLDEHIVMQARDNSVDMSDEENNDNNQSSELYLYMDNNHSLENSSVEQLDECVHEIPRKRKRRIKNKAEESTRNESSLITTKEEDWIVIGKSLGIQLKGLDSLQSAIAQKLMSDALFYAKFGKLNEHSFISLSMPQNNNVTKEF